MAQVIRVGHLYPLKVTRQQRETLLEYAQLSRNLKKTMETGRRRDADRPGHVERTPHTQRRDLCGRRLRAEPAQEASSVGLFRDDAAKLDPERRPCSEPVISE